MTDHAWRTVKLLTVCFVLVIGLVIMSHLTAPTPPAPNLDPDTGQPIQTGTPKWKNHDPTQTDTDAANNHAKRMAASLGQTPPAMSPRFREQARIAFRAIERLDPDDRAFQAQHAHRAVNGLLDNIKTPADKYVHDILFTWLAELEQGRVEAESHPASWRQWMKAEVECQTEAEFYFGGLTEEGKQKAAERIAHKTCLTTAKELGRVAPP